MIATLERQPITNTDMPRMWGMSAVELHDRFWASRGVCVVRLGEVCDVTREAELYLLTDPRTLVIFRLTPIVDRISWTNPQVMLLRLGDRARRDYRETVACDDRGRFERIYRHYGGVVLRTRVALTRDRQVAVRWQGWSEPSRAWRQLRGELSPRRRDLLSVWGRTYDHDEPDEVMRFTRDLINFWKNPGSVVPQLTQIATRVWSMQNAGDSTAARFIGPAWIGAGRSVQDASTVMGPAALWDAPSSALPPRAVVWSDLEPTESLAVTRGGAGASPRPRGMTKRAFDIAFSLVALAITLPLYPLVMLAIWLEDGRPFFFSHRRETLGGREFSCFKFRSMRRDAERVKAGLRSQNQADGPQFFVRDDPRLTRVGRILRRFNIDELPQFLNVLLGHMSVVGPRPSPRVENQYCPAWREARLSVRPGITGLWQTRRTRRPGLDFQEWIRYDLEYVQDGNWRMDLTIIYRTIKILLWG